MTRFNLFNIFNRDIKSSLYCRPLRGSNYYLIVIIIKCWAYTNRIAHYKSITMAQYSGNGITTVPVLGRFTEYFGYVHIIGYHFTDLHVIINALTLILIKQSL